MADALCCNDARNATFSKFGLRLKQRAGASPPEPARPLSRGALTQQTNYTAEATSSRFAANRVRGPLASVKHDEDSAVAGTAAASTHRLARRLSA